MKFWAKIKFNNSGDAENLIRAFFEEFNANNMIKIKGEEAEIEIIFDKPPEKILESLSRVVIKEFNYLGNGKNVRRVEIPSKENYVKSKLQDQPEGIEQVEQEIPETIEEQAEHDIQKEVGKQTNLEKKDEFLEIAESCFSYDEFLDSAIDLFEMNDKLKNLFKQIIEVAENLEKITWKNIQAEIKLTRWQKLSITLKIAKKYENSDTPLTILKVIKKIVKFKNFNFSTKNDNIPAISIENQLEYSEKIMNILSSDCLEEKITKIDKSQTIENRLKQVLTAMGWRESDEEEIVIFKITNIAVRKKNIDFHKIYIEANITTLEEDYVRMKISKFVNDFVNMYDSTKKIKVSDFLEELRNLISSENELE